MCVVLIDFGNDTFADDDLIGLTFNWFCFENSFTDFEVYLKTKIAEVHHISNDEGPSCNSDPNPLLARSFQLKSRLMKPSFHAIESMSAGHSGTNESKVSVYYTPNDSIDQPQLQLSPMHINFIRENLNTFTDCTKPSESMCKFDFDMHRLEANLEQEIDRRRRRFRMYSEDDDDDEEIIEINTENTRMLNGNNANMADSTHGYIPLNTLPKRFKCKRPASGKELYYSLENLFEPLNVATNLFDMNVSNKTIDEASETQITSSTSDQSSSNNTSRSNPTNIESSEDNNNQHPSQSVLVLNEASSYAISELQTSSSSSMPNISKSESKEQNVDANPNVTVDSAVIHTEHSQLDQMLPNENAKHD